ncbi:hypothetical protein V5R04_07080 [Jonesiaceae bacterium BS-20]|uniref:Uncharacterized protein n=1 Tax=Jonesiaceae bacterium BS-20 TaxID=3120821 RepID=A0AAU7E0S8_9MICO
MSIKIYEGYRLAEGADPFSFIQELRELLNPIRDQKDAQRIARKFALDVDCRILGIPNPETERATADGSVSLPKPLSAGTLVHQRTLAIDALMQVTWSRMLDEQREYEHTGRTGHAGYDPARFELSIGRDDATGRYLMMVYTETPELMQAFRDHPQVSEYGYWDNTDPLETVTDEEWAQRKKAWMRVWGSGSLGDATLTFALRMSPAPAYETATIAPGSLTRAALPTNEERAHRLAYLLLDRRRAAYLRSVPERERPEGLTGWGLIGERQPLEQALVHALPKWDTLLNRCVGDLARIVSSEDMAAIAAATSTVWDRARTKPLNV